MKGRRQRRRRRRRRRRRHGRSCTTTEEQRRTDNLNSERWSGGSLGYTSCQVVMDGRAARTAENSSSFFFISWTPPYFPSCIFRFRPLDTTTDILFPGSTTRSMIFNGGSGYLLLKAPLSWYNVHIQEGIVAFHCLNREIILCVFIANPMIMTTCIRAFTVCSFRLESNMFLGIPIFLIASVETTTWIIRRSECCRVVTEGTHVCATFKIRRYLHAPVLSFSRIGNEWNSR